MTNQTFDTLNNLSDVFQSLSYNITDLIDGVNLASKQLSEITNRLDISGIIEDLTDESENVCAWLTTKNLTKGSLVEAITEYENILSMRTLNFLQSEAAQEVDPATGRKNKDYTGLLLDELLRNDPAYNDVLSDKLSAERNYRHATAELQKAEALLSATKHKAQLASSLLVFLSEPARALGSIQTVLTPEV